MPDRCPGFYRASSGSGLLRLTFEGAWRQMNTFVALLAAIGVGTIISALVGHLVAISNHRQDWINALRDDLAEYFKALEAMGYVIRDYMQDLRNSKARNGKPGSRCCSFTSELDCASIERKICMLSWSENFENF